MGLRLTYASGGLASVEDAAGRTTTFTVGADGLLSKASLPDTTSVSYGYTGGLLASVTDPAGKTSSYTYDANKRLSSYTDPAGGTVSNVYGTTGRITSQTDQNNKTTTFTWDGSRESHTTSMTYDGAGRMLTRSSPSALGHKEIWTYDASGNITGHTDGRGNKTTYAYNTSDQLTTTTDPLNRATAYAYDADSNPVKVTTPRGTTTRTYDARGLVTKTDYSDTTPDVTFGYDDAGRMTARANAKISEDFVYNTVGDLTKTRGFAYTYDAAGQMLTRKYSDGNTIGYTYDNDGRTATMTADGATTTYTSDAAGNLTRTALPNTETEERTYDRAGRVTAVTSAKAGTTVTKTALTLSAAGLPTRVDVTRAGVGTGGYDQTYDTAGRLTTGCYPQPWITGCAATRTTSQHPHPRQGRRSRPRSCPWRTAGRPSRHRGPRGVHPGDGGHPDAERHLGLPLRRGRENARTARRTRRRAGQEGEAHGDLRTRQGDTELHRVPGHRPEDDVGVDHGEQAHAAQLKPNMGPVHMAFCREHCTPR